MRWSATHEPLGARFTVMQPKAKDDHMANTLDGDAGTICNVDACSTPINGLITVHDELILKCDDHVMTKYYPQRFSLDDTVAQRAGLGVDRVIRGVGHSIYTAIAASKCATTEAYAAVSKGSTEDSPIRVSTLATVDLIEK
ncbi:hypothetical protein AMTR_s00014p00175360 [Amborella trichopoda]|uniref:Uncharacterized protein n=1 Tax=Amborella trichopoda TaxID=13333 RepID=W1PPL4_AMBTC|nr:hypothetical protein AMTR_s00014p00175360 [Amborella trichopoda]